MAIASIRRSFLAALRSLRLRYAFACGAAQTFPSRPIELGRAHLAGRRHRHHRPAGGGDPDEGKARQPAGQRHQPPGGGGAIAYTYFKSKRGDPHTIMSVATLAMLNQVVRPELGLGLDNYTPLAFLAQDPQAVMVAADSPYKTLKDLVEAAKREPNSLVASVASPGGTARMLLWMIERETGAKVQGGLEQERRRRDPPGHGRPHAFHHREHRRGLRRGGGEEAARAGRVLAQAAAAGARHADAEGAGLSTSHIGTGRGFAMPADVPKEAAAHMEASAGDASTTARRGRSTPSAACTRTSGWAAPNTRSTCAERSVAGAGIPAGDRTAQALALNLRCAQR